MQHVCGLWRICVILFQLLAPSLALQLDTTASKAPSLTSGPNSAAGLDFDVVVPEGVGPFPVVIILHGATHNETRSKSNILAAFVRNMKSIAETQIQVVPTASKLSWNVVAEESKRDDITLIGTELTTYLASFANVQPAFKLIGSSNGAALINRILIENNNTQIIAAVTCGSQLNQVQWHDGMFYVGGNGNTYDIPKQRLLRRRLLQVTAGNDAVVPAAGGVASSDVPGNLAFLPWHQSAYQFARGYGYAGAQATPLQDEGLTRVSYLEGQVQACNYKDLDHDMESFFELDLIETFLSDAGSMHPSM